MSSDNFNIQEVTFSDGSRVDPGRLCAVIGPNNGGKTTVLREILAHYTGRAATQWKAVQAIEYSSPATLRDAINSPLLSTVLRTQTGYSVRQKGLSGLRPDFESAETTSYDPDRLDDLIDGDEDIIKFREICGPHLVGYLSTESRLRLAAKTETRRSPVEEREGASSLLRAFYEGGASLEAEFQQHFRESGFGLDIRFDFSTPGEFCFRVAERFPELPPDPRQQRPVISAYARLDEQGDGIRSFVATLLALASSSKPVLLIDEPEAFLHPPQAYRLGAHIARHARRGRQIILATHSSDILRGVVDGNAEMSIVRVSRGRSPGIANPALIGQLRRDPVLSTNRVLDGLFAQGAVVVEADSDVLFYSRVASQITSDEVHYVRAHNKQTIPKVIRPLLELGVPCAGIVDLDILRVRHEFESFCAALKVDVDAEMREARGRVEEEVGREGPAVRLARAKTELNNVLTKSSPHFDADSELRQLIHDVQAVAEAADSWAIIKKRGIDALSLETKIVATKLVTSLAKSGVFIVPVGELESWMLPHGIDHTRNKGRWLELALQKLDEIGPEATNQINPWKFVAEVHQFLVAPNTNAQVAFGKSPLRMTDGPKGQRADVDVPGTVTDGPSRWRRIIGRLFRG